MVQQDLSEKTVKTIYLKLVPSKWCWHVCAHVQLILYLVDASESRPILEGTKFCIFSTIYAICIIYKWLVSEWYTLWTIMKDSSVLMPTNAKETLLHIGIQHVLFRHELAIDKQVVLLDVLHLLATCLDERVLEQSLDEKMVEIAR